jgi:hypothetical protein
MFIQNLPEGLWHRVWNGVYEEIIVAVLIAVIALLLHFIFKKVMQFAGWFRPIRVYGKWYTFLAKGVDHPPAQNFAHAIPAAVQFHQSLWGQTYYGLANGLPVWLIRTSRPPARLNEVSIAKRHENAELHQFLNWVWGEAIAQSDPTTRYIVRGQIVGEKLSLVYRERNGFDSGAILLDVKTKDLMQGFEVGRDSTTGAIYTNSYTWRRR